MPRNAVIRVRVTEEEKASMEDKALACGCTLSDLVRQRMLNCRLRQTPEEKERLRLLAQAGNNINQLARWANIHKGHIATVEVVLRLEALWLAFTQADERPREDTSCT